jgi:hypothetical protein
MQDDIKVAQYYGFMCFCILLHLLLLTVAKIGLHEQCLSTGDQCIDVNAQCRGATSVCQCIGNFVAIGSRCRMCFKFVPFDKYRNL